MSKEKQFEIISDLLVDFDEMGFVPSTTVPDREAYAIEWRNKLTNALQDYRKQSEGEWIKDERSKFVHRYHCSVCNFFLIGEPTKYCEDCGAKMKGDKE